MEASREKNMDSLMSECPLFFKKLIDRAGEMYRFSVNGESLNLYWGYLKKYSEDEITQAFDEVFKREEWFPNIATIIKYIPPRYQAGEQNWPTLDEVITTNKAGIAQDSLKIIRAKMNDELMKEEYYQEMLKLHQKYPHAGFGGAAEEYRKKSHVF